MKSSLTCLFLGLLCLGLCACGESPAATPGGGSTAGSAGGATNATTAASTASASAATTSGGTNTQTNTAAATTGTPSSVTSSVTTTGEPATTDGSAVTTMGGAGGAGATNTTTGDTSTTTGGSALGPCDGADLFCDDFETAAAGSLPMGAQWLGIDDAACASGNFDLGVSADKAYSGSQSLKITNASWAQCRIAANFGDADEFWVRANLYWENDVDFSNKEVLAIDLAPATNLTADDPAIRFGSRTKEPCTQNGGAQITIIGLGSGESTGCDGNHPLPQASWYCFEAHVNQGGGSVSVKSYINGEALTYSSTGKEPTESIDSTGVTARVNHVRLGMFSTTSNLTGTVYVDDIAVSSARVGCY